MFNFIMAIVGLVQWRRNKDKKRWGRIANVPMTETKRKEFSRKIAQANAAEIIEIAHEMESFVYSKLTADDLHFCKLQIERRCKKLMEHYSKYQCFPE